MRLHIYENPADDEAVISVDGIPEGFTDYDVQWSIREMAREGNKKAQRALDIVRQARGGSEVWIDLKGTGGSSRVYHDGAYLDSLSHKRHRY